MHRDIKYVSFAKKHVRRAVQQNPMPLPATPFLSSGSEYRRKQFGKPSCESAGGWVSPPVHPRKDLLPVGDVMQFLVLEHCADLLGFCLGDVSIVREGYVRLGDDAVLGLEQHFRRCRKGRWLWSGLEVFLRSILVCEDEGGRLEEYPFLALEFGDACLDSHVLARVAFVHRAEVGLPVWVPVSENPSDAFLDLVLHSVADGWVVREPQVADWRSDTLHPFRTDKPSCWTM